MKTITLTVALDLDDDAQDFAPYFAEYITLPEGVFFSDYGPGAWGGYEGPFVHAATVTAEDGRSWSGEPLPPEDDEGE